MSLPETVRVKLSSEAAESISLTPVVIRDIPMRELIEQMLGITGKDEDRIRELLLRGTLVSGASRFRWNGWEADGASIRQLFATFPDSNPARPFVAERCSSATLYSRRSRVEIPREAGARKGILRKLSFWDALMEVADSGGLQYRDYSYKHRADRYRLELSAASVNLIRKAAGRLQYATLKNQVGEMNWEAVEFLVERG